jgi:membrane protease YdiL (CAAX protease family)
VALGAWQDAEREAPFLLEPDLRPLPSVRISDGLVSAFLFSVLQIGLQLLLTRAFGVALWPALVAAFGISGALVGGGALLVLGRRRVPRLLAALGLTWGEGRQSALQWGAIAALPASAVAVATALVIARSPALQHESLRIAGERGLGPNSTLLSVLPLYAVLAPLCEELIFRGLIYKGLRQSFTPTRSILIASLIFALAHPLAASLPVFSMACCAAFAFERSRSLASPIIVHAAYNVTLTVVGALAS